MNSSLEELPTSSAVEDCGHGDGGENTMAELPVSEQGQDRMSAVLSRIVTTMTIAVGYMPWWWELVSSLPNTR